MRGGRPPADGGGGPRRSAEGPAARLRLSWPRGPRANHGGSPRSRPPDGPVDRGAVAAVIRRPGPELPVLTPRLAAGLGLAVAAQAALAVMVSGGHQRLVIGLS